MNNPIITLQLTLNETDRVLYALSAYIDYLRDGDEGDKELAKRVEEVYDKITKQIKWS